MSVTYLQGDKQWKVNTGRGLSLANNGCGPCSIANIIANSINPKITPVETWNYMYSKGFIVSAGSIHGGMTDCLKKFGITCKHISAPKPAQIWAEMDKGNRWAILCFGSKTQGGVRWAKTGHFIAATGYKKKGGYHWFYTRDSGTLYNNNGWYCYEDTMSSVLCGIWICTSDKYPEKFGIDESLGEPGEAQGGSTSLEAFSDSGQPLVLEQAISKLYSSDNFQFVVQNEKDTKPKTSPVVQKYQELLSNLNAPLTENSADAILAAGKVVPRKTLLQVLDSLIADVVKSTATSKQEKVIQQGTLLSYPSVVEAPVILLNLNGVIIGGYGNSGDVYPNYIDSMTVSKVNGKINQYTINLTYQVRFGEDPNFIDKLLSNVGFTNKIQILYGDSNSDKLFRDDEAVVTNVTFNEIVTNKTIKYTISAMSSIISATSMIQNFGSKTGKPSTLIRDLFYSNTEVSKALLEALPGMANRTLVESSGLIPTNDTVVTTQPRLSTTPISQIAYYVSGMYNSNRNSAYYLNYMDDTTNDFGGPYLKITEVGETSTETLAGNYFEIDVGYPGNNFVMNFSINSDVYFPLVYKYNNSLPIWNYDIDAMGNITKTQTNSLVTNNIYNKPNVVQSNWWRKVTEYPISAELTIKGLLKPIVLASYIKVNVLFYGNTDLASGLYTVTGQTDSISGNGYTTTLSLLRVSTEEV